MLAEAAREQETKAARDVRIVSATSLVRSAWGQTLIGALTYAALLWLSQTIFREHGGVPAVWPSGAVALAMILRQPRDRWLVRLAACFVANCAIRLAVGDSPALALAYSLAAIAEVLLIAASLWRWRAMEFTFARSTDLLVFALVSLLVPSLVSVIATPLLWRDQGEPMLTSIVVRFLARGLGYIIFTPALMLFEPSAFLRPQAARARNFFISALVLVCGLGVVFGQSKYPILFVALLPIVFLTYQFEFAGAALGILCTAIVSMAATYFGRGPIALIHGPTTERMLVLQLFLASCTILVLPLAAAISRRREHLHLARDARDEAIRGQASLRDGQSRLRQIIEFAPNAIVMIDAGGRVELVNAEAEQTFGYSREEMLGAPIETLVPERFRTGHPHLSPTFTPDHQSMGMGSDLFGLRKDGSEFPIDIGSNPIMTDEGLKVISAIIDVSARKAVEKMALIANEQAERARARLAESERLFRLLVQGVTDYAIFMLDTDGRVLNWNAGAERAKGYAADEIVGHHFSCFYTVEDQAAGLPERGLEVARAEGQFAAQGWRVKKGGALFWADLVIEAMFEDGKLIGYTKITCDVTARKLMEAELRASKMAAETATQAKTDFLANMSHELRTPLSAIIGFSGLLAATGKLGEMEAMFVKRIGGASHLLLRLINDLLDLSKVSAGQIQLEMASVDLRGLADDALQLLGDRAEAKGLSLRAVVASDLAARVRGDPIRLSQIITNLLGNAVKFTASGSVTLSIYSAAPGQVRFEVADSGVGIPADQLDNLFGRFVQADSSTSRLYGGTGLGLAICKGLIELMGGRIGVHSAVGAGSTFWFEVPLAAAGETVVGQPGAMAA